MKMQKKSQEKSLIALDSSSRKRLRTCVISSIWLNIFPNIKP